MRTIFSSTIFKSCINRFYLTTHKVKEIKNNCMLIVNDQNQQLPYMAQIQTTDGRNGIVLKIDQNGDTYIGMYEPFQNKISLEIKNVNKNWKNSFNKIAQSIVNHEKNAIFDVNSNIIESIHSNNNIATIFSASDKKTILNGNKRRLKTASLILNVCNDLYYGDMISFLGCRGSKKTSNALKIINQFNNENSVSIYLNPQYRDAKEAINKAPHTYAFSVQEKQKPTDIGIYMLTLKTINLCKKLKQQGMDILLVVDNFKQILTREWNFLQAIKLNSFQNSSSKSFQYNNVKISPISILNEIYSNCNDQSRAKSIKKVNREGSLTALILSQRQEKDEVVQSITSYTNNIKHLMTLSSCIQFPLDIKNNKNAYVQKVNKGQSQETSQFLRTTINEYLTEKKQSQLRRSLYKNDIRDAPWDYYTLLDAQWWIKGLRESQVQSFHECMNMGLWLRFNIEKQIISQWTISARQSYKKLTQFLRRIKGDSEKPSSRLQFVQKDMEQFIEEAKMEGLLSPFKKDYLI